MAESRFHGARLRVPTGHKSVAMVQRYVRAGTIFEDNESLTPTLRGTRAFSILALSRRKGEEGPETVTGARVIPLQDTVGLTDEQVTRIKALYG